MSKQNFSKKISFDQTPEQVFNAVKNVRGWWSELIEGNTEEKGDVFIYRHKDIHASTQELTEVLRNEKITWLVTDSHLSFLKDNSNEWDGTQITFEIEPSGNKTALRFTHHGLSPQLECFEACSGGWNYYLQSLESLIRTGTGNPDQ